MFFFTFKYILVVLVKQLKYLKCNYKNCNSQKPISDEVSICVIVKLDFTFTNLLPFLLMTFHLHAIKISVHFLLWKSILVRRLQNLTLLSTATYYVVIV